jgi:glycosyltransferase involved in cell wall biosynthesis
MGDPRVRLIQFASNKGRGVARQAALDAAKGEFLAFLDADDWYFPTKLEEQRGLLAEHENAALVSSGLAVLSQDGASLVGVAGSTIQSPSEVEQHHFQRLAAPGFIPVTSMVRMDLARQFRYRPDLLRCQDIDFLIRLCVGRDYLVLRKMLYGYAGWSDIPKSKITTSLAYERRIYASHFRSCPLESAGLIAKSLAKEAIYRAVFAVGQQKTIERRRFREPTLEETASFECALPHSTIPTEIKLT